MGEFCYEPRSHYYHILLIASDPFAQGLDYLYEMQRFAIDPALINLLDHSSDRIPVCTWIGHHITSVNAELTVCLQACHDCFHLWQQRPMQIFAVPLSPALRIDGFCNLQTDPITILIDVGRVVPDDWLALVVHEYAHAHAGSPGHHEDFVKILEHLCLGLGLEPPPAALSQQEILRSWPYCHPTKDPLAFWRGQPE